MAVIIAYNFEDRLVLLEDGRELEITQFYGSGNPMRKLHANDKLLNHHRVDTWEEADVFVAEFPGTGGAHLIVEIAALLTPTPQQIH